MSKNSLLFTAGVLLVAVGCASSGGGAPPVAAPPPASASDGDGWLSLFNGADLSGWRANENKETFSVKEGAIVANGPRSHLFYVGPDGAASFTNFEWKADVMTKPSSNSGMYVHTEFQESGWPDKGYEIQVNNTHKDWRKTGGLYAIVDVKEPPAKDDEWFTQHIVVEGKRIVVRVNGRVTVDYTEPENPERPDNMKGRLLSKGTIALQGHDPVSVVYFKNLMLKPLP